MDAKCPKFVLAGFTDNWEQRNDNEELEIRSEEWIYSKHWRYSKHWQW